jgi:hypothetical protein
MRKTLASAVLAITAALTSASATADIVNLDGLNSYGVNVTLSTGDHLVSWIGIADGGLYDAWSPWGDRSGNNWLNHIDVSIDQVITGYGTETLYSTPADALAATQGLAFHLNLSSDKVVNFMVADGYFADNRGGVSLYISNISPPVPEPETYAMMLAGLGLLGFAARRKQSV